MRIDKTTLNPNSKNPKCYFSLETSNKVIATILLLSEVLEHGSCCSQNCKS